MELALEFRILVLFCNNFYSGSYSLVDSFVSGAMGDAEDKKALKVVDAAPAEEEQKSFSRLNSIGERVTIFNSILRVWNTLLYINI